MGEEGRGGGGLGLVGTGEHVSHMQYCHTCKCRVCTAGSADVGRADSEEGRGGEGRGGRVGEDGGCGNLHGEERYCPQLQENVWEEILPESHRDV